MTARVLEVVAGLSWDVGLALLRWAIWIHAGLAVGCAAALLWVFRACQRQR